jgi:hydrogenase maturation factor HypF (carbamoyltransferase family)
MSSNPSNRRFYAGLTTCLRCDRHFYSWDRRQNRLCQDCREYLDRMPSDEDSYTPPKRRHRPLDD